MPVESELDALGSMLVIADGNSNSSSGNLVLDIGKAVKKAEKEKKKETWDGEIGKKRELALLRQVQKHHGHKSREGDNLQVKFDKIKLALEKSPEFAGIVLDG